MLKPLTVLDPSKLTPEDCAALRRDGFSVSRRPVSPTVPQIFAEVTDELDRLLTVKQA